MDAGSFLAVVPMPKRPHARSHLNLDCFRNEAALHCESRMQVPGEMWRQHLFQEPAWEYGPAVLSGTSGPQRFNQKISFAPSQRVRFPGFELRVLVIFPKFPVAQEAPAAEEQVTFGFAKCGVLVMLKASARNWNV